MKELLELSSFSSFPLFLLAVHAFPIHAQLKQLSKKWDNDNGDMSDPGSVQKLCGITVPRLFYGGTLNVRCVCVSVQLLYNIV